MKKYGKLNIIASFTEGEGEAFDVELKIKKSSGESSKGIIVNFESIKELKDLANYLIGRAQELKARKEDMPIERVRCGSCNWYGITDTGFGMCRLHAGRVASDSFVCTDYK